MDPSFPWFYFFWHSSCSQCKSHPSKTWCNRSIPLWWYPVDGRQSLFLLGFLQPMWNFFNAAQSLETLNAFPTIQLDETHCTVNLFISRRLGLHSSNKGRGTCKLIYWNHVLTFWNFQSVLGFIKIRDWWSLDWFDRFCRRMGSFWKGEDSWLSRAKVKWRRSSSAVEHDPPSAPWTEENSRTERRWQLSSLAWFKPGEGRPSGAKVSCIIMLKMRTIGIWHF